MVRPFFVVFGFLLGTFAEYWVHRLLHIVPALRAWHQKHHDNPVDYTVGGSWTTHAGIVLGISLALALVQPFISVGFLIWYAVYATLHYYCHHVQASKRHVIDYFQDLHIEHHAAPLDGSGKNFAVTFPVWDWLFGTYQAGVDRNRDTP